MPELVYDNEVYNQFVEEFEELGYEVEDYNGRFFYHGPAVRVEDNNSLQQAIRDTSLILQWDNMGLGYIVYPK